MPREAPRTVPDSSASQKPPKVFWLISALLIALFWSLAALKHHLLHSTGWDLGIFDQVAWQMSQGLEPRSTLIGLHHMGDHGAWMFYAIAPLYRLAPSVHWLFLTQALGLILTAWPLWHLGAQASLKPRERWLVCGLWWLQPVMFNVNLFDFHPETWAMPLLALAIWANRAERRQLWLMALFAAMGCRDGLSLIVIGLALEQVLRRRWRWAAEALLLGGWLLFLAAGLYPILNNGSGVAAASRYIHLCEGGCEGAGHMIRSALLDPIHLFGALDWPGIVRYLLALALPLTITWRIRSLPMLAVTLLPLAANMLSSWSSQRDVLHQYSLPLAVPLVVASIDGLAGDRLQRRFRLLHNLWAGYLCAALCWVGLTQSHSQAFFGRYLARVDQIQPAQEAIGKIPDDAGVLTYNHLIPHLSHRRVVRGLFEARVSADSGLPEGSRVPVILNSTATGGVLLTSEQIAQEEFDTVLLLRPNGRVGLRPGGLNPAEITAVTIPWLQGFGWVCEEVNHAFVTCRQP